MISWSHSRVAEFLKCGFRMWCVSIAKKVKFVENKFTREGKKVHTMFEERIRDGTPFPPEYAKLEKIAAQILAMPGDKLVENQLALDKEFKPCGYKDWNRAWCRVIIDILVLNGKKAFAGDYKTGNPDYLDGNQLELTAAVLFETFPELHEVTTGYIWTKKGELTDEDITIYTRDQRGELWDRQLERYAELYHANEKNEWPKRPSNFNCGYCDVNKAGLCDAAAVKYKGR